MRVRIKEFTFFVNANSAICCCQNNNFLLVTAASAASSQSSVEGAPWPGTRLQCGISEK